MLPHATNPMAMLPGSYQVVFLVAFS